MAGDGRPADSPLEQSPALDVASDTANAGSDVADDDGNTRVRLEFRNVAELLLGFAEVDHDATVGHIKAKFVLPRTRAPRRSPSDGGQTGKCVFKSHPRVVIGTPGLAFQWNDDYRRVMLTANVRAAIKSSPCRPPILKCLLLRRSTVVLPLAQCLVINRNIEAFEDIRKFVQEMMHRQDARLTCPRVTQPHEAARE